jgi:F-box/leucine-rich repeat protein 4
MRHLNVGGVLERLNADDIAKELGNSCPDLESVDFWKAVTLTSQGINALTRCKNLREVDFSWWYVLIDDCFVIYIIVFFIEFCI